MEFLQGVKADGMSPARDNPNLSPAAKLDKITAFLRVENKTSELRRVLLSDLQRPERQGDSTQLTIAQADQKNYMALFDDLQNPESSPELGKDLRAALVTFFKPINQNFQMQI